jgi:hypothetical protein
MGGRGCYRARPPGPLLPSPGPRRPRPTPAVPQLPDGHGHLLPGTGQPVQGSQWRKKTLSFQAPTPQGRTRSAGTDHGHVQGSAHTLSWPDFGLTRLSNKERQPKPTRAIPAGQLGDAQVTDACVTVYGSADQIRTTTSPSPDWVTQAGTMPGHDGSPHRTPKPGPRVA